MAPSLASAIEVKNREHLDEIFGRYAPGGDCQRQPQVLVELSGLTFLNGEARHKVARIERAASFMGNVYQGVGIWLMPLYGTQRPIVMNFNAGEQRGTLTIEGHDRGWNGGPPLTARHQALVDASPYRRCN
ncbi:MAG: hypothetical protein M3485_09435 [Pseudomonadota bacterium]|nr:hypothetical protein [Pseudomonadota bacterium]